MPPAGWASGAQRGCAGDALGRRSRHRLGLVGPEVGVWQGACFPERQRLHPCMQALPLALGSTAIDPRVLSSASSGFTWSLASHGPALG